MLPQRNKLSNKRFDYCKKKYSNPFFRGRKRKKIKPKHLSWRIKLIIIELIILACGIIWFCCFANYFAIANINVSGAIKISAQDIKDLAWQQTKTRHWLVIPQKNLWLFNENKLTITLHERYFLDDLIIEKKSPDTLIIKFKEKIYSVIWQQDDKYYYVDTDGNVITETSAEEIEQKNYPLINYRGTEGIIDKKVENQKESINYIIELFNQFKNERHGFAIDCFIIDNEINTVKMIVQNGPEIYFNISEDAGKQITKLIVLINETLKDDFSSKQYIDLRYGDRVYYR